MRAEAQEPRLQMPVAFVRFYHAPDIGAARLHDLEDRSQGLQRPEHAVVCEQDRVGPFGAAARDEILPGAEIQSGIVTQMRHRADALECRAITTIERSHAGQGDMGGEAARGELLQIMHDMRRDLSARVMMCEETDTSGHIFTQSRSVLPNLQSRHAVS